ncbi:uncharacterized protein LOC124914568 [Impatiens glandulifera]|uniref:uncharacterized protein LOC124914568 n=1 Tax=Impatiens glandulifera TaxID=253017 RepID=UPI001FB13C94|nr:uncharacterized protein LOC124914568 [Impatiens glandulifera]
MSVEWSFEAWEEVQRHGIDLADRLAQGVTGLIQSHITPPSFHWPGPQTPKLFDVEFPRHGFAKRHTGFVTDNPAINGVSAIFDIGTRLGQAGADFGSCVNGVQQFFRRFPVPFIHRENTVVTLGNQLSSQMNLKAPIMEEDLGSLAERFKDYEVAENDVDESNEEEMSGFVTKAAGLFGKSQGIVNITSTFDSRTRNVEGSLVARGDLWRVEASQGSSVSRNDSSSLFLVQLGPVLFVRDSTLLLPVHLSKQHLLWYGYDRKSGLHSLCPAVWSKQRRWLMMSMICLNPVSCSFMDLQFPNGQVTYVSGEGLSTNAFVPFCGGLLQAQGQYPGEMRFSFSRKNKWGTRITPIVQWPDKSFSLAFEQALAWRRSGLMVRPTIQLSMCPTFGGSNPGLQAEIVHSVNEEVNLICGYSYFSHPTAFASLSLGRSKWNGNLGTSGVVARVETPISNTGRPSFSIQLNCGTEL